MLFQKKRPDYNYRPEVEEAVVRSCICTGERSAGFRNKQTGAFHEVMLIRSDADLTAFQKCYHLQEIKTIY